MKKIFATILTTIFTLSVLSFSMPILTNAANLSDSFNTVGDVAGGTGAGYNLQQTNLISLIGSIIQVTLSLLGVVFLILSVYAGWMWMTARGDSKKIDTSLSILTSAVIGLIIVLFSYALSSFIIKELTKNTLIK